MTRLNTARFFWMAAAAASQAIGQQPIHFVGLESSTKVDKQLLVYLRKLDLPFQRHAMDYDAAVRRLADWTGDEPYLAHMTPYACVAAEMLGAHFEVLGTYNSKATDDIVYHSYFIVNKEDMKKTLKRDLGEQANLTDLAEYLRASPKPARFIYHDKFSTSSYFLPSLYFRDQRISAVSEAAGALTPIRVQKAPPGEGSAYIIEEVAAGRAQLAAVWDKYRPAPGSPAEAKTYSIPLPTEIPNDLLVLSTKPSPSKEVKERILAAIRASKGDPRWTNEKASDKDEEYQYWIDIKDAPKTLDALGELRRLAATTPHYAAITIRWSEGQADRKILSQERELQLLRAVQNGVRLSGTEFVLYDPQFHRRVDVTWSIQAIHDGALALTSQMGDVGLVAPQHFSVSFMNSDDLTTRIAALVQSRLHRIRYVWAYEENYPTVVRDLEFTPEPDVTVQKITWTDPERNEYEEGIPFEARIVKTRDSYKLRLSEGLFPRGQEGAFKFEPMSNTAYRIILKRPSNQARLFVILTWASLGLLALIAASVLWDLRRKRPAPMGLPQTYRRLMEEYHGSWKDRQIRDSDVLWCDPRLDEFITHYRTQATPLSKEAGNVKLPWIPVTLGTLRWVFYRMFGERFNLTPELLNVSEVGHVAALERLIRFLVRSRRVSGFVGKPLEWDALEEIVRGNLVRVGIEQNAADARLNRDVALAGVVSRHFQEVLEKAKTATLFRLTWELEENGDRCRLVHKEDLGGNLRLVLREGTVIVRTMVLEFEMPADPGFQDNLAATKGEVWVLGRVPGPPHVTRNGTDQLHVTLEPIALLKPMVMAKGVA